MNKALAMNPAATRQKGLSLIEVLIALLLGLILMIGITHLFMLNARTHRTSDEVARLQETGRFGIETIAADLRMAGYQGCAEPRKWPLNIVALGLAGVHMPAAAIEISDRDSDGEVDTLRIRYASGNMATLTADMSSPDAAIVLDKVPDGLRAGDIAVIADCTNADAFAVSDVDNANETILHAASRVVGGAPKQLNSSSNLSKAYKAGARLMRFRSHEYWVSKTGRTNKAGDPIYALYRDGDELVEGVESMQVQFGERLADGNVRYRSWSEAGIDLAEVVAVRVGLLIHSIEQVLEAPDTGTYNVAGTEIAAADPNATGPTHEGGLRMRRVFSTTVSLRNRE